MPKQLYPKPNQPERRVTRVREVLSNRPYHVEYIDPNEDLDPEWRYYNTETAVKLDSWFRCRVLGFRPEAILFNRDEVKPGGYR